MIKTIIVVLTALTLFTSCRSSRKLQTAIAKKDTVITTQTNIPAINPKADSIAFIKDNYTRILNNRIIYTTFSGKIDVDYTDGDGKKFNVNAHVRMYKDSAIWVSVTAILGIEGLRALITKDSVKILNKQDKVYTARSVSYLQDVTALPLTLSSLQDLLIGNPVFLDSNIVSYSTTANTISLQSNGRFFKNLFTLDASDKLVQSSKLDDMDEMRNRTCYLTYADYKTKDGVNFSTRRTINVSEKKKLDIKLDYKQYAFNETLSFPFNVPKNYKQE